MAATVTNETDQGLKTVTAPGPDVADAFVADRQAFWGSFTHFVMLASGAIAVLLILLAFFLG